MEGLHPTQIAQVGADRGSHCQTILLVVLPHRPLTCKAHLELHCAVMHVLAMIAEENELNFGMHFHQIVNVKFKLKSHMEGIPETLVVCSTA